MTFVLAVLLHYACCAFFVCAGLYALAHGFIKTGGWLIAGAVISILTTTIENSKGGEKGAGDGTMGNGKGDKDEKGD